MFYLQVYEKTPHRFRNISVYLDFFRFMAMKRWNTVILRIFAFSNSCLIFLTRIINSAPPPSPYHCFCTLLKRSIVRFYFVFFWINSSKSDCFRLVCFRVVHLRVVDFQRHFVSWGQFSLAILVQNSSSGDRIENNLIALVIWRASYNWVSFCDAESIY